MLDYTDDIFEEITQVTFLRNDVIKVYTEIDFFDQEQRELYIDRLIDRVFLL